MKNWILRNGVKDATESSATCEPLCYDTSQVFCGLSSIPSQDSNTANALGISSLLLHILQLRGISQEQDIQEFLSPNLRLLAPLDSWPGLPEAAEHVVQVLLAGKKLAVWGDYDVDGITSTALVLDVLTAHGFEAFSHIPERQVEGYGLNIPFIDTLAAQGIEALLTVDCGISDEEAITHAKSLGMTVIVSDHHLPPEILPPADAICNPRMGPCPCPDLAGVGVAFFLMCAVNKALKEHTHVTYDMRNVLDLVALGTLADVVNLQGQNRILVKNGLLTIGTALRPGLAALKKICKFDAAAKLGSGQIVFSLAPRINAAGRMGHANIALELLRATDLESALPLAEKLDALNTERRKDEERIHQQAREQALTQQDQPALVLYGKDWHQGIIGIVASRIVEEFYKPTLILCDGLTGIKGSGRSVREFHLHEGLSSLADILLSYGGHKLAAGLSLAHENLSLLRERFTQVVRDQVGDTALQASLTVDALVDFSSASNAIFLRELELMQPFGMGNAEPTFASPPLLVKKMRYVGSQKEHVFLEVMDESTGITLHAKAWRKGQEFTKSLTHSYIYLAYTPLINTYNGIASVEVRIKDWKETTKPSS